MDPHIRDRRELVGTRLFVAFSADSENGKMRHFEKKALDRFENEKNNQKRMCSILGHSGKKCICSHVKNTSIKCFLWHFKIPPVKPFSISSGGSKFNSYHILNSTFGSDFYFDSTVGHCLQDDSHPMA